jgi:hypothetical protein
MAFIPSPGKLVRFIEKKGIVVKEVHMNRAQRRRMGIKNKK